MYAMHGPNDTVWNPEPATMGRSSAAWAADVWNPTLATMGHSSAAWAADMTRYRAREQFQIRQRVVVLMDRSQSMAEYDPDTQVGRGRASAAFPGHPWTRWDSATAMLMYLLEATVRINGDDGLSVYFFSSDVEGVTFSDVGTLRDYMIAHRPSTGSTNLHDALECAFADFPPEQRGTLFVVITDGAPDPGQETTVPALIYRQCTMRQLSARSRQVFFVRVGDDPSAIKFLEYMDDAPNIGFNVDTKSDNEVYELGPLNALANAVYEHLENKGDRGGFVSRVVDSNPCTLM